MFDLLGVVALSGAGPSLPRGVLPTEAIPTTAGTATAVERPAFAARFLNRATAPSGYHHDGARHVFVVGEARMRSDAPAADPGAGPLPATRIAALRDDHGDELLARLKGNFTLVFVDEETRRVELFNGRYGISPFYYALTPNVIAFSTSLAALARTLSPSPDLDPAGVIELELFNYPVGSRTYFSGIRMLRPAEAVDASASGVATSTWWDVRALYDAEPYSPADALDVGSDLFARTVRELAETPPELSASFTSGFDSRAIWAVLGRRPDVLGYSFGIHGSLNVTIPERIAADFGLAFDPIYLEEEYERAFPEAARRALLLSDCLSTVERANYPYAFERLGRHSPVVLTGLFGSELLRTFQNVGLMFTAPMAELTRSDAVLDLDAIVAGAAPHAYVDLGPAGAVRDEIEADLADFAGDRFRDMTSDQRFYMFLLTEGLRKYFGAETHMERAWAENRFPFLDDEFVEFAFRAPFSGVHSRPLTPTVGNRFRSQHFYAYVIRQHWPELLPYPTDHGYPPSDLFGPASLLRIGTKFAYQRWRKKRAGYREFKTDEWTEQLFAGALTGDLATPWATPRFGADFRDGSWKERRPQFVKAASLKMWLDMLERGAAP